MSETLHRSPEQHKTPEIAHNNEAIKNKIEAGKNAPNKHAEEIEQIRQSIEKHAHTGEKSKAEKAPTEPSIQHVTKELKSIRYKETMHYVRRHLTPRERKFSSFIHTPAVEKVSEVGAKTVARPSGLLGGGLIAFVGSISVLYIARHYGFEVPNSLFIALFIVGFAVGLLGEFIIASFTLRRRTQRKRYGQM